MRDLILGYLKNQNKTSIIKSSLVLIPCILILISQNHQGSQTANINLKAAFNFGFLIFVFGAFALPFLLYLNKIFIKIEIDKPKWGENPFTIQKPLIAWQFISISTICQGFCLMLKDFIDPGFIQPHIYVEIFSI